MELSAFRSNHIKRCNVSNTKKRSSNHNDLNYLGGVL